MKRDIRENEEFLTLKNMIFRKKTSLRKVASELNISTEYIYLSFYKNKRDIIDKVFNYVTNL